MSYSTNSKVNLFKDWLDGDVFKDYTDGLEENWRGSYNNIFKNQTYKKKENWGI